MLANDLDQLTTSLHDAVEQLKNLVPTGEDHLEWVPFENEHKIQISDDASCEWVYDTIVDQQQKDWRRHHQSPWLSLNLTRSLTTGWISPTDSAREL